MHCLPSSALHSFPITTVKWSLLFSLQAWTLPRVLRRDDLLGKQKSPQRYVGRNYEKGANPMSRLPHWAKWLQLSFPTPAVAPLLKWGLEQTEHTRRQIWVWFPQPCTRNLFDPEQTDFEKLNGQRAKPSEIGAAELETKSERERMEVSTL